MFRPFRRLPALFGLLLLAAAARAENGKTPLDDYVNAPDPSFKWSLVKTIEQPNYTAYVLDMTSQNWRKPEEVDRTEWKHWVTIVKPRELASDIAFLLIGGGSNKKSAPEQASPLIAGPAVSTKTITVELSMIPNQPLVFMNDGQPRSEDDLIAYTWDKVMTTKDPTWSARMPMVKASVRAMDAVQAFLATPEGGGVKINRFAVAGGSKRGWTTWLTGAVDKRVCAILPIVIDILNVKESMRHHHDAYGFWAPAVGDYVRHKIPERNDTPEQEFLMSFEDPYFYLPRLAHMPKYVINAAGDQFFLPDGSQFYWDKIPGEKHLRYIPNTDHGLGASDAPASVAAFLTTVVNGTERPEYSWTKEEDGSIRVKTSSKPSKVLVWRAVNPEARDFRMEKIGRAYLSSPLEPVAEGEYLAKAAVPEKGFAAFFVELTFDANAGGGGAAGGSKAPFKVTSEVSVVPDTLPHKGKPLF